MPVSKYGCLENLEPYFCRNYNETALCDALFSCNYNLCIENIPLQGIQNSDFLALREGLTCSLRHTTRATREQVR